MTKLEHFYIFLLVSPFAYQNVYQHVRDFLVCELFQQVLKDNWKNETSEFSKPYHASNTYKMIVN
jgi:hypothetical protein